MDWLDRLRHRRAAPARTGRLDTAQARQVVRLVDCRKVYAELPGVDVIVAGLEVAHE